MPSPLLLLLPLPRRAPRSMLRPPHPPHLPNPNPQHHLSQSPLRNGPKHHPHLPDASSFLRVTILPSALSPPQNSGATQTRQCPASSLHASDAAGPIPLTHTDDTAFGANVRRCYWPATGVRAAGRRVRHGPRIDLRREPGSGEGEAAGLVGMGEGSLPRPVRPESDGVEEEEWDVTVRWELDGLLPPLRDGLEVKAVCSLGEGKEVNATSGLSRVTGKSHFTVGMGLNRWPSWGGWGESEEEWASGDVLDGADSLGVRELEARVSRSAGG